MMNRNTSLLAALALGALVGGGAVWRNVGHRDSGEDSSQPQNLQNSPASGVIGIPTAGAATPAVSGSNPASPAEESAIRPAVAAVVPETRDLRATMRRKGLPAQATIVDQVVIPVPSEIFAALNKVGRPHWKEVLRPFETPVRPRSGAEETALLLGNVIAEGFIAVEAENANQVKRVGQSVLNLSGAIGVRKTVMARSNAILEGAERRDWSRVRNELDRALSDVKTVMGELNSDTLADLVSLGGWLRGAEALATVVHEDYEPATAELLHQPALVEHFSNRLRDLSPRSRSLETIIALERGLAEIQPHIVPKQPMGEKQVAEILVITRKLTKRIEGRRGR